MYIHEILEKCFYFKEYKRDICKFTSISSFSLLILPLFVSPSNPFSCVYLVFKSLYLTPFAHSFLIHAKAVNSFSLAFIFSWEDAARDDEESIKKIRKMKLKFFSMMCCLEIILFPSLYFTFFYFVIPRWIKRVVKWNVQKKKKVYKEK